VQVAFGLGEETRDVQVWCEGDFEARGTDDQVELVVFAVCHLDPCFGEVGDFCGDHEGI